MAAYDIQKHFKGLRVGRRQSRADPFATGFEDEIGVDAKKKRRSPPTTTKPRSPPTAPSLSPTPTGPTTITTINTAALPSPPLRSSRAGIDAFRDSDDEQFLNPRLALTAARSERRPSPAPASLSATRVTNGAGRRGLVDSQLQPASNSTNSTTTTSSSSSFSTARPNRTAVAQAAGNLAYLDDSEDEEELLRAPRNNHRFPSPAPRHREESPAGSTNRSSTPRGGREAITGENSQTRAQPSRHTVASPFAGTKYLEDSSDSDEEAVTSRNNSTDDTNTERSDSPESQRFEVKRTDKGKIQNGGGVSWRAFSAGRAEKRNNEIEALSTSLMHRGRTISFSSHAVTDDGHRIPIAAASETFSASFSAAAAIRRGRGKVRGKSPPRRAGDVSIVDDDDALPDGGPVGIYDPTEYKTNPFTGAIQTSLGANGNNYGAPTTASPLSMFLASAPNSELGRLSPDSLSDRSGMADSITSVTMISPPQTIPEGRYIEHSGSALSSPNDAIEPLSRNASVRSLLSRPMRIPPSQRSSRRSTSANTSISPAHAFLSTWSNSDLRATEVAPEPQPDDEGQAIGVNNEYIIGRQINRGGFGVVKEVHTLDEGGNNVVRAVKIVRKSLPGKGDMENEKCQQELDHEISVWRHLKHRHILDLIAVYETEFATFCVMDLNHGGSLFDVVRRCRARASAAAKSDPLTPAPRKGLDPILAQSYAHQLASALRYLHEDIKVCHRDVKLENCLIDTSHVDPRTGAGNLRLCDFGLADFLHSAHETASLDAARNGAVNETFFGLTLAAPHLQHRSTTSSIIGTLEYASPKGLSAHQKLYETAGDVWAYGVVVFVVVVGDLPFRHPIPAKTVEKIMAGDWGEATLRSALGLPEDSSSSGADSGSPSASATTSPIGGPHASPTSDSTSPTSSKSGSLLPTSDSHSTGLPITGSLSNSPAVLPPDVTPREDERGYSTGVATAILDLVRGCLSPIDRRLKITEVLQSPWFEGMPEDEGLLVEGGIRAAGWR